MLYDPDRRWIANGLCVGADPAPFFSPAGMPDRRPKASTQAIWDKAKRICAICPVLEECRRDTLGEDYGVWGGRDEHERWLLRSAMSKRAKWKKWPEELRMEWGQHLAELREQGAQWRHIQTRTGLAPSVCMSLISEWRERRPEPVAPEPVKPKAVRRLAPVEFPEARGQRHAWVRNGRRIADGWYGGETSDGVWVRMQIYSGRGNVFKFFRAADVQFYNPQRRYIVPYFGRPDAADTKEGANAA